MGGATPADPKLPFWRTRYMYLLPDTDDISAALEGMTEGEASVPDEDFKDCPARVDPGGSDPHAGGRTPGGTIFSC
jgi:hypothetical protein